MSGLKIIFQKISLFLFPLTESETSDEAFYYEYKTPSTLFQTRKLHDFLMKLINI